MVFLLKIYLRVGARKRVRITIIPHEMILNYWTHKEPKVHNVDFVCDVKCVIFHSFFNRE